MNTKNIQKYLQSLLKLSNNLHKYTYKHSTAGYRDQ